MAERRPIEARIDAGRDREPPDDGVPASELREALASWASTVALVAVRDGGDVHGVTVTSFFPVSLEPPLIAVSLGANAQPVPWLDPGAPFVVSLLSEGQRRVASAYADSLPQIPPPFAASGPPVVEGAVAALICTVHAVHPVDGGARLVVGVVEEVRRGEGERPLLYWRRGYWGLAGEE